MLNEVVHTLGSTRSRRQVVRFGGRGLAGGLLAAIGLAQAKPAAARCRRWILSGGPDPADELRVDDDLTVKLNGRVLLEDDDGSSSSLNPLRFKAERGDRLLIVAFDAQANCHRLSPLFLHCATGGTRRKLSDGVPTACPNVAVGRFFKKKFTI